MMKQENHSAFEYAALIGSVYDGLHSESFYFFDDIYKLATTIRSKDKPISQEVSATQPHSIGDRWNDEKQNSNKTPMHIHTHILCTVWQQINCKSTQKMHTSIIRGQFIDFFFFITFISIFCRSQIFFV